MATLAAAGALPFRAGSEEPSGMRYVTLGRTGIRSSVFLGDWMGSEEMYRIALDAGVNYWHKIGEWRSPAPYELFQQLDRDSFACDTTISTLDKDRAIETFERNRKRVGLEMIDGFKIHSEYRSAEDVKTKMGAVQAFEELKRQGKDPLPDALPAHQHRGGLRSGRRERPLRPDPGPDQPDRAPGLLLEGDLPEPPHPREIFRDHRARRPPRGSPSSP